MTVLQSRGGDDDRGEPVAAHVQLLRVQRPGARLSELVDRGVVVAAAVIAANDEPIGAVHNRTATVDSFRKGIA